MAEKVGRIHVHELPSEHQLEVGDVYRCHCNTEFYVGKDKTDGMKGWFTVDDLVHYDRTVKGETFIGNFSSDIEWDSDETPAVPETEDKNDTEQSEPGTTSNGDSTGTSSRG